MAAQITDRQRKKIIADYLELGSYRATARRNHVSADSVTRIVRAADDFQQKAEAKKAQDTADILAYMEQQRGRVCELIDIGLAVLPGKIQDARTATEVTTALGTLIDKWAMLQEALGSSKQQELTVRFVDTQGAEK